MHCHCTGEDKRTFGDCRSSCAAVTSQGYEVVEEPAWLVVELQQPKVFRLGSLFLHVIFPGLGAGKITCKCNLHLHVIF